MKIGVALCAIGAGGTLTFFTIMPRQRIKLQSTTDRDVSMGGTKPPNISNLQESWSTVSHAARKLAAVYSVTISF